MVPKIPILLIVITLLAMVAFAQRAQSKRLQQPSPAITIGNDVCSGANTSANNNSKPTATRVHEFDPLRRY